MEEVKGRGGRRSGSGRPVGSGNYGESTKVVRLPESLAKDVQGFVERYQELERIILAYAHELEPRKTSPRATEAWNIISDLLQILETTER